VKARSKGTICHLSSVAHYLTPRTFHMECVPISKAGYDVTLIGSHGFSGRQEGVDLVGWRVPRHRALRMLNVARILSQAIRQRADLYQLHDPELLPAGLLLKLLGAKVVYDACEDFPTMMQTKGYLPRWLRPAISRMVDGLERAAAHCLDGIITADQFTLRRLAHTGRSRKMVFFNSPILDLFQQPKPGPKRFDFVYRGGLSERAGTLLLLEAMRILVRNGRRPRMLLMGYCDNDAAEQSIRRTIAEKGLAEYIEFRGPVRHELMAGVLSEARVGLSPLHPIPKFLRNIPVKVWEYWACGLPVIASDLPPTRAFLRHGDHGLLVRPDDPEDLAGALAWALDNPENAEQMGQAGRRAVVDRINNSIEVRKLLLFYQKVLQN